MTIKRKKILIFSLAVMTATLAAIAIRTLALFNNFDSTIGYYDQGAVLPVVFNIIAAITILSAVALPFLFKKGELKIGGAGQSCRVSALLAVAAFALLAWERWSDFLAMTDVYSGVKLITALISPILTVCLMTFFVACCHGLEPSPLTAIVGSLSIIAFAVELAVVYNDLTIAMNSPNKIMFQFACIGAMLYTLAELRVVFSAQKPRFYLFSIACAVFFLGASSVPSIIASAAGIYENKLIKADVAFFAVFLFCLFRLIGIAAGKQTEEITDEEIAAEGECYFDPAEEEETKDEEPQEQASAEETEEEEKEGPTEAPQDPSI